MLAEASRVTDAGYRLRYNLLAGNSQVVLSSLPSHRKRFEDSSCPSAAPALLCSQSAWVPCIVIHNGKSNSGLAIALCNCIALGHRIRDFPLTECVKAEPSTFYLGNVGRSGTGIRVVIGIGDGREHLADPLLEMESTGGDVSIELNEESRRP